jgi:beta-mannanase
MDDAGTGGTAAASGGTGGASTGGVATGGVATGGVATGGAATGGSGATEGDELLVPESGALLGGFIGTGTIEATESQIGRQWAIHLQYFDWPSDFISFARSDIEAGRIPYVTWEPWSVTLDAIASGSEDATIRARAEGIAALGGTVMLRFAHEMNGDWYPWDGFDNGGDASAPPKYVAAYRHICDVFANAGVTNVLWVFCPNVDSVPNESWNNWESYYPGDEYVDWMCYDGYDWGGDTFASMTSRIYSEIATKNKPIMLGETSTQEVEKAAWINAIIPAMQSEFPMLRALVWFHVDKENDWRYDSTQSSLDAFVAMANDPYFNP